MKLNKIDHFSWDDIETCYTLVNFLALLKVPSADEESDSIYGILQSDFCGDCQQHADCCSCGDNYGRNYYDDDDRAYDRWKDEQIEKQLEKTENENS